MPRDVMWHVEAGLYWYGVEQADRRAAVPVDDHNLALAALRYLTGRLGVRHMGGGRTTSVESVRKRRERTKFQRMWDDPDAWITFC